MWCVPALLQTFFNKSVSFSCGVIYFYVRLVIEGQYLRAVVFFPFPLTRRSWSQRKQPSRSRCASRSTTAWEESLSRRWASPPRSAPTPAGPKATFISLSHPLIYWFMHFCFSRGGFFSPYPPTTRELALICSFVILHPALPKKGNLCPRLLNTHRPVHTSRNPARYL